MTKLHEWQAFARASGLRGWSRLKKDDLVIFLIENLWRDQTFKAGKKNLLDDPNPDIGVPLLIPEKKPFPQIASASHTAPKINWQSWLENVTKGSGLKKKVNPRIEKLKKKVGKLWKKRLIVDKGKSALKGFAKQFFIRGDDSVFPQEFLLKARGHVVKLLQENPHTKVKCVLNCKMSRMIGDEEIVDEPFFHSRQKKNLGTNMEIVGEMENEMIENLGKLQSRRIKLGF